jgi:hypothetical protein
MADTTFKRVTMGLWRGHWAKMKVSELGMTFMRSSSVSVDSGALLFWLCRNEASHTKQNKVGTN